MRKQQKEKSLSKQIATFLKAQYPKLLYRYDLGADIVLTMGQKASHKALQMKKRGYPDLHIIKSKKDFNGLYIELKNSKSDVFLKDGITYKKAKKKVKNSRGVVIEEYDHIQEQVKMHEMLREEGYLVEWGFGFVDTVEKIKNYLNSK